MRRLRNRLSPHKIAVAQSTPQKGQDKNHPLTAKYVHFFHNLSFHPVCRNSRKQDHLVQNGSFPRRPACKGKVRPNPLLQQSAQKNLLFQNGLNIVKEKAIFNPILEGFQHTDCSRSSQNSLCTTDFLQFCNFSLTTDSVFCIIE